MQAVLLVVEQGDASPLALQKPEGQGNPAG